MTAYRCGVGGAPFAFSSASRAAGIDVAGFVQLLTAFFFSRCTHGQWFPFKLLFVIKSTA